eukprot:1897814-Alexandrium_andersonii.AAC.2
MCAQALAIYNPSQVWGVFAPLLKGVKPPSPPQSTFLCNPSQSTIHRNPQSAEVGVKPPLKGAHVFLSLLLNPTF